MKNKERMSLAVAEYDKQEKNFLKEFENYKDVDGPVEELPTFFSGVRFDKNCIAYSYRGKPEAIIFAMVQCIINMQHNQPFDEPSTFLLKMFLEKIESEKKN